MGASTTRRRGGIEAIAEGAVSGFWLRNQDFDEGAFRIGMGFMIYVP